VLDVSNICPLKVNVTSGTLTLLFDMFKLELL
jgi:hypothetical protein